MRIAYLAFHGSVHTRRWVGFFAAHGHDVHVVTCGDTQFDGSAAYEVHDVGPPPFGKGGYIARIPAVRRILRRIDPDVLHVHWLTSYGLLGLASGVRPIVATAHGDDVLIAPERRGLRWIVRRVLLAASLVTVPSEQMRAAVADLVGDRVPVEVFQYGVETERLAALADSVRDSAGIPGECPRLVSVRPLLPLYRVDVLVEAVSQLRSRGLAVRCSVYGDGPERPRLESDARRLGLLPSIQFFGQRSEEETERGLAHADAYVSLAESDGTSIALLEALALGPVPVLSDIPANRAWVVDGENGVLTAIDPVAAADAIERALSLGRSAVRDRNRELVASRADRDQNLGIFEKRLSELVSGAMDVRAEELV